MIDRPLLSGPRLERPLRSLMTPGVVSLPDTATLRTGFAAMLAHGTHAVLVVSHRDGAPLGWLSSRALLAHSASELGMRGVADGIDEPAVVLPPGATAQEAIERMRESGALRVAVAHEGSRVPEGIVADLDLIELLVGA